MTWTTPMTATANTALTAAQWNASVRDNLNETAVAKATTAGSYFVTNGVNSIAEREILDNIVETSETSPSTTYTSIATNGPLVTITTGTKAMVWISAQGGNSGTGSTCTSYEISGATTVAVSDNRGILFDGVGGALPRMGVSSLQAVTPGSNVFRMLYRVTSGTGTFAKRRIQVMAL